MQPSANTIIYNPTDHAEMVLIKAGTFLMGSSDADIDAILAEHPDWRSDWFAHEKPLREVTLSDFWIYRYPVTVAEFRACCEATGWTMPAAPEWGWQETHPMVNVSWQDITHYATWAQAAIPTEEQWEKAARGPEGRLWPWGNTWEPDHCSHAANAVSTQPVDARPGNISPYGVCDMVGNVWEWCNASSLGDYEQKPVRNVQRRSQISSGHVLRGGSWQSAYAAYLRCAFRSFECDGQRTRGGYHRPTIGFRCVATRIDS